MLSSVSSQSSLTYILSPVLLLFTHWQILYILHQMSFGNSLPHIFLYSKSFNCLFLAIKTLHVLISILSNSSSLYKHCLPLHPYTLNQTELLVELSFITSNYEGFFFFLSLVRLGRAEMTPPPCESQADPPFQKGLECQNNLTLSLHRRSVPTMSTQC